MVTTQISSQSTIPNTVDAIWALILCQSKSVQRALVKRFATLDAELQVKHKANTMTPQLKAQLEASRQEIADGMGTECRTKEELQSFLAAL